MESFESDDNSIDSLISDDSNESDIGFESDGLLDDLDELQISTESSNEDEMHTGSLGESHTSVGGFPSVSLDDTSPVSVFRQFFTEEIFNVIVDQTNIYGKQKLQRNRLNRMDRREDVQVKDIESFLGTMIVMGISDLPKMKLYWSKDNVFHNGFISSIMSRNRFLQIFHNLHIVDNSLELERDQMGTVKFTKSRVSWKSRSQIFRRIIRLDIMVRSTKPW